MTDYVAGFLFDTDATHLALVRKKRPSWQKGKLNAIGGHVEWGELPHQAMIREFREETGVDTILFNWDHFATVQGKWGNVQFFRAFSSELLRQVHSPTDEIIEVLHLDWISPSECLPNLQWLIPLAKYRDDRYLPVIAEER